MATPESKVKQAVVKILKAAGAYYFSPVTGGFGRSGVPDIVCCLKGHFIGIECKAGTNKPTALQQKNLKEIGYAGGFAFVVNEDNLDSFERVLKTLRG
jgi:Holliday junction resolvase